MAEAARLRILFLAHAYPRFKGDPVGSFIHNLAVALRQRGVDVVVSAPGGPGLAKVDVIDGVTVHRFRYAPARYETLAYTGTMGAQVRAGVTGKMTMLFYLAAALIAARRIARQESVDAIHAHWWFPAGLVAEVIRRMRGTPFLVTMHGSDLRLTRDAPAGQKLFRGVARNAGAMTAVSSWLAEEANELTASNAVTVAPMPVLTDLFHPGTTRDDRRLLFVGKLSEQKGLARLLRAMSQMQQDCRLTVVGAGRIDDSAVVQLADSLGLADRIEWLPILSQAALAEQYRRAAIHVIPALDEGLGLTAVESLLSETPVVGFASGGLPDIVLQDVTGILLPPADETKLARALDELLANPDRRASMGIAGREHASRLFSPDAAAERYARLYTDVMHYGRTRTARIPS
jgi:glycosyltransferase involved in cell wall biosynthesis